MYVIRGVFCGSSNKIEDEMNLHFLFHVHTDTAKCWFFKVMNIYIGMYKQLEDS